MCVFCKCVYGLCNVKYVMYMCSWTIQCKIRYVYVPWTIQCKIRYVHVLWTTQCKIRNAHVLMDYTM